jgi:3-dehydroquinate dehydratase II
VTAGRARASRDDSASRQSGLRILVLSGPNLDRLGSREPELYGTESLAFIVSELADVARATWGVEIVARQSNHEGDLVGWIGAGRDERFDGIVLNPGALTHTSVALLDAVKGSGLPVVEVHLTNPEAREAFRRRSFVARGCLGKIAGFGKRSYHLAVEGLVHHLQPTPPAGTP